MRQLIDWLAQFQFMTAAFATLGFSLVGSLIYTAVVRQQWLTAAHRFTLLALIQLSSLLIFFVALFSPSGTSVTGIGVEESLLTWLRSVVVVAWLMVALFQLGKMGVSIRSLNLKIRKNGAQAPRWLRHIAVETSDRMGGVDAQIRLLTDAGTAAAWGIAKPLVLLPLHWLTQLDEASLRLVLLHEMAHLRRNDVVMHLILSGTAKVLWFSPVNQQIQRWLAVERECAVDDEVVAREDALSYSRALLHCARNESGFALAPAFGQKPLLYRVQRLMNQPLSAAPRFGKNALWQSLVIVLFAGMHGLTAIRTQGDGSMSETPVMAQAAMLLEKDWMFEEERVSPPPPPPPAVTETDSKITAAANEPMIESVTGEGYQIVRTCQPEGDGKPAVSYKEQPVEKVDSTDLKTFIQIELPGQHEEDSLKAATVQKLIIQVDKQVLKRARL